MVAKGVAASATLGICKSKERSYMMKSQSICKIIGVSVLAFGFGILISFFLPETILVVLEAIVIVAVGVLFFLHK